MIKNPNIKMKFQKYRNQIIKIIGNEEYINIEKNELSRSQAFRISQLIIKIEKQQED